ncbi:DNA/RNA non-specific endonuclease [Yoonia sp. 2307UL14-13]|uniref:DNA/RNA non-specific endonuclease n=1 Tax=Yoonia sp. 2307UL14-13 TaxID=3126506 RepID=UPI003094B572
MDDIRPPQHFAGRDGYDRAFLGDVAVPLPMVPLNLARPSDATDDRPNELRYQHFSILYSLNRKSPVIAALNIDGSQTIPIRRRSNRWRKDGRIPTDAQLGRADFGNPDIDRGHMIRRAATNWGRDRATAEQANDDTYHYTVASPQHEDLNQNNDTWLGLENYIMESTRTFGLRANVFTGPIFSDEDPPLGDSGARLPLNYFKVVSMLAEDGASLHATSYVLGQSEFVLQMLRQDQMADFTFGAFGTFQVRIADLEAMTGYDFGALSAADPLAQTDVVSLSPLLDLAQITL